MPMRKLPGRYYPRYGRGFALRWRLGFWYDFGMGLLDENDNSVRRRGEFSWYFMGTYGIGVVWTGICVVLVIEIDFTVFPLEMDVVE